MPTTPMDQLKAMSHSDIQRFANYLGSRLRTIAKVYHTRVFASPEQKIQLYNTWEQELTEAVTLLGILQCSGKPLAIPKYMQTSVKSMDGVGGSSQVPEEWAEEDAVTTVLPENGGDWWDVSRRKDPPPRTLAHLMFRWSLFECPEKMPLSELDYFTTAEDLEQHIGEIEAVREDWRQLCLRYRRTLEELQNKIEEIRGELFRADQRELGGLKKDFRLE